MQLLTKEILNKTPDISDGETKPKQVKITAKFFDPTGSFTWYLTEIDKSNNDTCFGFVTSEFCPDGELGYFTISELEEIKGPFGLGIERDKFWTNKTLKEVMDSVGY